MITEQDLKEAIAECQGTRNPTASTCIKLAAFLTIQRELYGQQNNEGVAQVYASVPAVAGDYSYDNGPYVSDTEFGKEIDGMDQESVMEVMDELMSTLQVVQPRIYASVMRKLREKR